MTADELRDLADQLLRSSNVAIGALLQVKPCAEQVCKAEQQEWLDEAVLGLQDPIQKAIAFIREQAKAQPVLTFNAFRAASPNE